MQLMYERDSRNMGKKGDLLRQQKKENTKYTFTAAQLEAHDQFILQQKKAEIMAETQKRIDAQYEEQKIELEKMVREEWDARAKEFSTEDRESDFFNLLQYLLAVPARVLIERFRWKPIPKDGRYDRRNHMTKFGECIIDEINKIQHDEMGDIRTYCQETYELYGVKFERGDEIEED